VGAVAGSVVQRQRVIIEPVEAEDTLRLHLPQGLRDFHDLEQAVAWAQQQMIPWLEAQARQAGAAQVKVEMTRQDARVAARAGWGDHIYIGTELIFTAVGRPSPAAREARRDRP
jgi:hypothetical protein